MANGSILLVGDASAAWTSCAELLRRAGYAVVEAGSTDAALRLMRGAAPAALLLRIDANAAALRFCRRVRSHPPFAGLPILGVLAGRPRLRLTGAGFTEIVREPVAPEHLLSMVARWLPRPAAGDESRRNGSQAVAPTSEWRGLA